MADPDPPPIMDRYRGRPEKQAETEANYRAWERLRWMSRTPSPYSREQEQETDARPQP